MDPPPAISGAQAVAIFGAFAFAYFISALLRAVTATLAPVFSAELGLGGADLGLLAGAYFLGFSLMQLPLGHALDATGPRRVLVALLVVAILGCMAFAVSDSLATLVLARAAIGVGVSACLMAPLTCYRRIYSPGAQMRANSWMLMTGSLGMMASTVPVQWLLPSLGWRGLFWVLAGMLAVAAGAILLLAPRDTRPVRAAGASGGYAQILSHPMFVRLAPVGFFIYGGLIAVQALWAGPWLTRVAGWSDAAAAAGLLMINGSMLLAFLAWGMVLPRLASRGLDPERLMRWALPVHLVVLAAMLAVGGGAGAGSWAVWCVCCSVVTLSQPAIGASFPVSSAGRALSAFNLVIFAGVFVAQWGIGWGVDRLGEAGYDPAASMRLAFAGFGVCATAAYAWFVVGCWRSQRPAQAT